ncbi:HTH-like domain-containing protein [Aurantimonas coralicida]|uniref:HTH-like domain-containing protein n=1 Tax=Aurantimonas coralicida TaxID=182270 RepID=UPI003C6C2E90
MTYSRIYDAINNALGRAPEKSYSAEMHVQMIKYAGVLRDVSGREFCTGVGINPSWAVEFAKMKKISSRLIEAGLNPELL